MQRLLDRRGFIKAAGAVAGLAALGAKTAGPRIGIFSSAFRRPTIEGVMDAVRASGIGIVQLCMPSAGMSSMPDEIPTAMAERIGRAAAERKITIAGVQGTFNMCHPDPEHRRTGLRRLDVLARACKPMGTSIIGLCTGTRDRENMWRRHPANDAPDAWRDMLACMRAAVEIARKADVVLAFEIEVNNVVDSARKARRLLDEVHSPHLKVTLDAANLFHAGELSRMAEVLDNAFALIGKDIVAAHAKDVSHDGDAGHEPAGHGRLDYDRYVRLLRASGYQGPMLLHSLNEAQVPGCVAFLRSKLAQLGN
jgi:sugar phosphate isomerase/epimerase